MGSLDQTDFWSPRFDIETRDDGTILMQQADPLPAHMPTLADYFDKWADATPDQVWIAQREAGGDWRRITYGDGRDAARRIGASLLTMGLGPNKPLLILSGNSLQHALLAAACFYVGIPYAPVSPAYSLISKDHGKLRDIAALLKPGAVYAEDGMAFAPAIASISTADLNVITPDTPGTTAFASLLSADPGPVHLRVNRFAKGRYQHQPNDLCDADHGTGLLSVSRKTPPRGDGLGTVEPHGCGQQGVLPRADQRRHLLHRRR
jgi:feruloyl-CoA synthase